MPLPKAPTKPATLLDLTTAVLARPPRPKGRGAQAVAAEPQSDGAEPRPGFLARQPALPPGPGGLRVAQMVLLEQGLLDERD